IPDYSVPTRHMSDYDEQTSDDNVWLIAIVLTLVVLGIVIISIRRGADRPALDKAADRRVGRFGRGGESGNW
ncbi:TPM domain-containing protein, partial [Pseudomonas syringae pv. tagetis]